MAQVSKTTNKLYSAVASFLHTASSTCLRPMAMCLDLGDMSAFSEATNAPATLSTGAGLTIASNTLTSTTTAVANDTCRCYHSFVSATSASVTGFEVMTTTSGTPWNMLGWCAYASTVNLENTDTLNNTMDFQMVYTT